MPIQDVGTIATWTPARLTRYIQGELNQRNQIAKTSVSADNQYIHGSLTFSSGDMQTADTILARPKTGVITINGIPISTGGASTVSSVFGRIGAVVAVGGDYSVGQVTGAAPLASPALTGVPTAPTAATADNSTTLATTAYVKAQGYITSNAVTSVFTRTGAIVATTGDYAVAQITGAAPLASPTFTGVPAAPTPATADNSTTLATTAYVQAQGYAPLASPTFTGVPAAPTATLGTNTTQLATTAFVIANAGAAGAVTSVFGRTGAVVALAGDYTAAKVTNAADKASASVQVFSAPVSTGPLTNGRATAGTFMEQAQGRILATQSSATNASFASAVVADTGWRISGDLNLGAGANAPGFTLGTGAGAGDTSLFRNGVGVLNIVNQATINGATAKGSDTLSLSGRVFSGAAGTGGMWVDGGSTQFFGSVDATHIGMYNGGFFLQLDSSANLTMQGTYGFKQSAGTGGILNVTGTSGTLNTICGLVSFNGQSNTANVQKAFSVSNSKLGASDVVMVSVNGANTTAAGSMVVSVTVGTTSFSIVMLCNTANTTVNYAFNYWILKSSTN